MKAVSVIFIFLGGLTAFIFVISSENTMYFKLYILAVTLFGFVMAYKEERAKNKINRIKHFPSDVVKLMLQRQYEQQGIKDISVFQKDEFANASEKGFDWDDTPEGQLFWQRIILNEDFDIIQNMKFAKKLTKN